ncbi:MAG: hypothetical protein AAF318_01280 [Pseudomonadota bacterium]
MSRGVPTIVLVDLSANILVVAVVLLVIAMMGTAPTRTPVTAAIIAEAPTGAAALIDALYRRTRPGSSRRAIEITALGIAVAGAPVGLADLRGEATPVDLFVFDPRHHAAVRGALERGVSVREVTVPAALRSADGQRWNAAFASLFGRPMTQASFRDHLTRFLAGAEGAAPRAPPAREPVAKWLAVVGRGVLFLVALGVIWRAPALARRLAGA